MFPENRIADAAKTRLDAVDEIQKLKGLLSRLKCLSKASPQSQGCVWLLPCQYNFEDQELIQAPDQLMLIEGSLAFEYAAQMIGLIERIKRDRMGRGQTDVRRLPGVIGVDQRTFNLLGDINQRKAQFKEIWKKMSVDRKLELQSDKRSSDLRNIPTLEIYRQIVLLDTPPKKVTFFWRYSKSKIPHLSKDQAIEYLQSLKGAAPIDIDPAQHMRKIHQGVGLIENLPTNEMLALKKTGHGIPMVTIHSHDGQTIQKESNLPIFYLDNHSYSPVLTALPSPEIAQNEHRESRQGAILEYIPFLREFHLYRFRESSRVEVTQTPLSVDINIKSINENQVSLEINTQKPASTLRVTGNSVHLIKALSQVTLLQRQGGRIDEPYIWKTESGAWSIHATTIKLAFIQATIEGTDFQLKIPLISLRKLLADLINLL